MMDIQALWLSAFAGGVSSIVLLYRLFVSKSEFSNLKYDLLRLETSISKMEKDYVTKQNLELTLGNINLQLSHIKDSLNSIKDHYGRPSHNP